MDLDVLHREFAKLKARVDAITGGVDPGASPPQQYAEPVEQSALELHERVRAIEQALAVFPNFEQTAHLVAMHGTRLDDLGELNTRLKAVEEFAPVLERLREEIAREGRHAEAPADAGTAGGTGPEVGSGAAGGSQEGSGGASAPASGVSAAPRIVSGSGAGGGTPPGY